MINVLYGILLGLIISLALWERSKVRRKFPREAVRKHLLDLQDYNFDNGPEEPKKTLAALEGLWSDVSQG